jgi:hypothetical protein
MENCAVVILLIDRHEIDSWMWAKPGRMVKDKGMEGRIKEVEQ